MTKDLALLVGQDQAFLTTEEFLAALDENLKNRPDRLTGPGHRLSTRDEGAAAVSRRLVGGRPGAAVPK